MRGRETGFCMGREIPYAVHALLTMPFTGIDNVYTSERRRYHNYGRHNDLYLRAACQLLAYNVTRFDFHCWATLLYQVYQGPFDYT